MSGQETLDVLRRIRNRVSKDHCVWCTWMHMGSDPDAGRHMTEAGLGVNVRVKNVRAAMHEAERRCLAEIKP